MTNTNIAMPSHIILPFFRIHLISKSVLVNNNIIMHCSQDIKYFSTFVSFGVCYISFILWEIILISTMSFELFIAIHAENNYVRKYAAYIYIQHMLLRPIWKLRIVWFGPNFHQNEEEKHRNSNNLVSPVLVWSYVRKYGAYIVGSLMVGEHPLGNPSYDLYTGYVGGAYLDA